MLKRRLKFLLDRKLVQMTAVLDSGSDVNLMSSIFADRMLLLPGEPAVKGVGGETLTSRGCVYRRVYMKDDFGEERSQVIRFEVVDMLDDIILGIPWFQQVDPRILWRDNHWNYPLKLQGVHLVRSRRALKKAINEATQALSLLDVSRTLLHTQDTTAIPPEYHDFADVFSEEEADKLPPIDGPQHEIQIEEGKTPPWGPIYALAATELKELREYIDKALQNGWIRRSTSPAGAPVLFVPKKGGKLRLCVDYRGLNQVTRKNRAPLPLITEILDRLQGARCYTKLDLKDAYRRIRIKAGDEWKTAFRCRYGHFEYLVMPFGLTNAPATFQEYINEALRGLVDTICIVYLDDILIYSRDPADHKQHVREVLDRLRQAKLFANLQKCEFSVDTVAFLGFIIGNGQVKMEQSRVEAVTDWPLPTSIKDVQTFLGFTGFYRRFIRNYSKVTAPLTELTKKSPGSFKLGDSGFAAFYALKRCFQTAPLLAQYDPNAMIRIETDASDYAIGAVLSQLQGDRWHPVAFLSRKCRGPETTLPTPDKEMLAITEAFKQWRHYLAYSSRPTQVFTDHLNHTYLATKTKVSHKQAAAFDMLAPFNFTITHTPGRINPADPLSRRVDHRDAGDRYSRAITCRDIILSKFTAETHKDVGKHQRCRGDSSAGRQGNRHDYPCQTATVRRANADTLPRDRGEPIDRPLIKSQTLEDALREAQKGDALIAAVKQIQSGDTTAKSQWANLWTKGTDNLYRFDQRVYVPGGFRTEILQLLHDDITAGHQGVTRTLKRVAAAYYWPGMKKAIRQYVLTCTDCQLVKAKHHRPHGKLAALPQAKRPWEEISMDFITGLPRSEGRTRGFDAILVIVDRATRYAIYIPTHQRVTSAELADLFLQRVVSYFGLPKGILTDRGSVFTSNFWRSFCHLLATRRRLSTAFHPQTDGLTERTNQELEQYLRLFCDITQINWADLLPFAQIAHNSAHSTATGFTPAQLHGFELATPSTIRAAAGDNLAAAQQVEEIRQARVAADKCLRKAHENDERWYNARRKELRLKVGDLVMVATKDLRLQVPSKKLAARYLGPFRVIEAIGDHGLAYRIEIPSHMKVHNVFNVTRLEPFRARDIPPISLVPPIEGEGNIYEVEAILGHKYKGKRRLYKVRWKGYDADEDSWVKRSDFADPKTPEEYDTSAAASQNV